MKACSRYAQELTAHAATDQALDDGFATHLQSCAECRDALHELRRVVAINARVAAGLAEPARPISLPLVFLREQSHRRNFLKPLFWAAAATACLAIFFSTFGSKRKPDRAISFVEPPREETSWEPTWQRLREGVDALPPSRGGGSVVAHYRIKDAYSDLN